MSQPSCSDICEMIHDALVRLGFKINSSEDHTDMIQALSECRLTKKEEVTVKLDEEQI